jgi:hypothetical protein
MGSLSDVLAVATGLVLVFLLLSILTSYIQELISSVLNLRSSNLANAIQLLLQPSTNALKGVKEVKKVWQDGKEIWDKGAASQLNDLVAQKMNENIVKTFYSHPLIQTLSQPGKLPSYIPSKDFTLALFDMFQQAGKPATSKPEEFLQNIHAGIGKLEDSALKGALIPLIQHAEISEQEVEKQIAQARANVEAWFDSTMARSSGWYKRRMQWVAIGIGLLIAVIFNADTIAIAQSLWRDSSLRQSVSSAAAAYIQKGESQKADAALGQLSAINLPIGWNGHAGDQDILTPVVPQDFPILPSEILLKLLGLLITGMAVSHGSAIWFDLLTRMVNMRSSGDKPGESSAASPTTRG